MARRQTDNDRVMTAFHETYPPETVWNQTIWNRELGILKRTLFKQGYTPDEVINCIKWCKLKGKRLYSLAYIPYVIEQSKVYWAQLREREAEREKLAQQMDDANVPDVTVRKTNMPGWLSVSDFEEVE